MKGERKGIYNEKEKGGKLVMEKGKKGVRMRYGNSGDGEETLCYGKEGEEGKSVWFKMEIKEKYKNGG